MRHCVSSGKGSESQRLNMRALHGEISGRVLHNDAKLLELLKGDTKGLQQLDLEIWIHLLRPVVL